MARWGTKTLKGGKSGIRDRTLQCFGESKPRKQDPQRILETRGERKNIRGDNNISRENNQEGQKNVGKGGDKTEKLKTT